MDIQMILSALPGKPMGKADAGANAADGHFALALAGAGRTLSDAPGDMPALLSAQLPESAGSALPATMAAQQAMLQALSARDPDIVADREAAPLPDSLSLAEIMERLALIDGPHPAEARPLVDAMALQTTAPQAIEPPTSVAQPGLRAENAVAALAAADALRQAVGDPTRTLETRPAGSAEGLLNAAQPLTRQAGHDSTGAMPRAQLETGTAERPLRSAELARSTDAAPALRLNAGELRGMPPEAPRVAMASIEPTSPSLQAIAQPGGSAAQATPGQPMPAQASLPSPLQGQAWPNQLGQQLVQFARLGGEQQIEMKLNPAELGPLSITLKMTEQGAQAQFLSAHAQVRQVLEQAMPQLREALAEQGISLGETSVGEQHQREGHGFANQEGQRGNGANEGEERLSSVTETGMAENATGISLDGRVNLYA